MLRSTSVDDQINPVIGAQAIFGPAQHLPSDQTIAVAKDKQLPLGNDLVFVLVAVLRQHGHIANVLTHISGTDWRKVEMSFRMILDPRTSSHNLTPLARNILELLCADRGITGRIMKPYVRALLSAVLGAEAAGRLMRRIDALFHELQSQARQANWHHRIAQRWRDSQ